VASGEWRVGSGEGGQGDQGRNLAAQGSQVPGKAKLFGDNFSGK
jgi:hypothetical protein